MYDNFENFDQQPPEPIMTDKEKKSHKSIFSKICLVFFAFMVITNGLSIALSFCLYNAVPELLDNSNFVIILSSVLQYGIGFPLLFLMLKKNGLATLIL